MRDKNELGSLYPQVSLIRGGPSYRLQEAFRLVGPNRWNLGRRITLAVFIGWVVPILIVALSNWDDAAKLIKTYPIAARMLIAVPALLAGLTVMELRFRAILAHIYKADLLSAEDLPRMNEILATLVRLRDSIVPEIAMLVIIVVRSAASYKGQLIDVPGLTFSVAGDVHLTPAGWYGVLVSGPLFQFLLLLNIWKWLLWIFFAFKFSKLNLRLVPTHPDENGGLGFLGMSPIAFAPTAFAVAAVSGAVWRHQIIHHGAQLMTFKLPAIVLVGIVAIIALGPLIVFVPKLAALRRRGILEYSILGQIQSTEFHERWILNRTGREAELMTGSEIEALHNFGAEYDRIEALSPFPTDKGALIGLALSIAIPFLPTILAQIPLIVVLKDLAQTIH